MKNKIIIFLTFINVSVFAQEFEKPNYEIIKENISQENSNYYYPKLISRLKSLDTTFTKQEYRHLYYGYVFNDSYNPYSETTQQEEIDSYLNKEEEVSKKEISKFIHAANKSLDEFPMDLRLMPTLAYFYRLNGEEDNFNRLSIIFQNLVRTIIESGNGLTCETGFHVIQPAHEYVFMNMLELNFVEQSLTPKSCDYQKLEEGEYSIDGLYFDVKKPLERNLFLMKNGSK